MTITRHTVVSSALTALALLAGSAQAHHIWVEQAPGENAFIRFGEFGDNLRETSPGLLDKFGQPEARLLGAKTGAEPVAAARQAGGFALPFHAQQGESIVVKDAHYPLFKGKQGDKETRGWYYPAARLITSFAALQPTLELDLVPTGNAGEFVAHFKGQPLPRAKVSWTVQSGWGKQAFSDAQGRVQFDMPWSGTYVAEISHKDATPGERQGAAGAEKYDSISYVTSVTFTQPAGIAPLPAGPAAQPNK